MIRRWLGRLAGKACEQIADRWLSKRRRVIFDRDGVSPYLTRYYLWGQPKMADGSSPFDAFGNPKHGAIWPDNSFGLYLHRFHKGDDDVEGLHNHPWEWATSLVLAGGYREERRMITSEHRYQPFKYAVRSRMVLPFSINRLEHGSFHRVDLLEDEAWSFFLVGPRASSWGFWLRRTGEFIPWRERLAQQRRPE